MAPTIARLRTMGIAAQPTFGQAAPSSTVVLPLTNAPQLSAMINKVINEAALGSSYQVNDIEKTTRFTTVPLEFKIDEDQFPLIMKQRFAIASATTSVTGVYRHTLTYTETTNCWYTLFLKDDNQQSYVVKDVLFDNHDASFDSDFIRMSSSAVGAYPTATAVSQTPIQPKEFVGRMASYLDGAVAPATVTASTVLGITANFDFGLNSEDTRFGLGSADLAVLRLTTDKYMLNVSQIKSDAARYLENENLTTKQVRVLVQSTDRYIAVANPTATRPLIQFDVARAKMENYTEEPDLNELVRENFDLTAIKQAGVTVSSPMSMTILNATASY